MRKNNNTIEINGKRYDAKTGAVLSHAGQSHVKPKPTMSDVVSRTARQHSPHRPATAHTLMRQAVKKPGPSLKRRSKAQGQVDIPAGQPLGQLTVKKPVGQLDTERLRHAKRIPKSRLISHFPPFTAGDIIRVRTAQRPTAEISQATKLARPKRPDSQAKPRPKTTSELLDQAVQQATSHLEPQPKKVRHAGRAKRNASIGAAIALTGLIIGVVVTQNLSNVRLEIASAKAGLGTNLSNYKYAGFVLSQLNYSYGVVAARFNDSGNSHYNVTQKRSSWDSTTLLDTFVVPIDAHYRTVQAGSRTIYLYGNRNATWVDGGIWYVIQTDGSLGDRQLIDLATSP